MTAEKCIHRTKQQYLQKIGKTTCNIKVEIVDAKIPLLLRKSSLKKANTLVDLQND